MSKHNSLSLSMASHPTLQRSKSSPSMDSQAQFSEPPPKSSGKSSVLSEQSKACSASFTMSSTLGSEEKGEGNVKETESTTSHPAIESPSIRPKCSALIKSASYIPNRDAFPDRGPAPPLRDLNDVDAFVKWVLGPPIEDWTEEQRASVHRHHSLHYHGVESYTYPAVTLTPWVDTLPSPDSPEFEAAFNAGFYEEDT